jgi:excisionase family DNA binding protein
MPTPIDTDRDEPLVVSVARAATLLGISKAMAYELAHRGELPVLRLGRRIVVPRTGIDKLVASAVTSASPGATRASTDGRADENLGIRRA